MSRGAILAIYTHLLMETFNSAYARKGSHERTHNLCTLNFCFAGCMSHTRLLSWGVDCPALEEYRYEKLAVGIV
jgi:hypothetical protein